MADFPGGSPEEVIEEYIRRVLASSDALPTFEYMTFSGDPNDWRKADQHVLLRVTGRHRDESGRPYEYWVRLVAPSGVWHIPTTPTEMACLCPAGLWSVPGNGIALWGAQLPPGKVSQEVAYWPLDERTTLLIRAGGFAIKCGGTVLGIDKATGQASIVYGETGTHIALDPSANAIELAVSADGKTLASLRLDPSGIALACQSADGTKKHVWKLDSSSGNFVGAGTGQFSAIYARGTLGKVPTSAIVGWQTPPGTPAPSATWTISLV